MSKPTYKDLNPDLGAITLRKDSDSKNKKYNFKINENVEIYVTGSDGVKRKLKGPYLNIEKPVDKQQFFIDNAEKKLEEGKITEEQYEEIAEKSAEMIERYSKGGNLDFVTFQISGQVE